MSWTRKEVAKKLGKAMHKVHVWHLFGEDLRGKTSMLNNPYHSGFREGFDFALRSLKLDKYSEVEKSYQEEMERVSGK